MRKEKKKLVGPSDEVGRGLPNSQLPFAARERKRELRHWQ
jgi:hypothetical protein